MTLTVPMTCAQSFTRRRRAKERQATWARHLGRLTWMGSVRRTSSEADSGGISVPEVLIRGDCGELPAYVALPDGEVACPGLVVVHDLVGMASNLRSQADWLAGAGYLAVAPNLFHRGWRVLCIRAALRAMAARRGKVFDEIETARRWAAGHERCTGTVGIIGFCMGGGFALLLAPRGSFAAASVNYGHVPKDADSLLAGACPLVGSYGGKDLILRGAAQRLERALTVNGVDHDVKLYPNAAHSFLNDHRDLLFRSLRIAGFAYDDPSAADARRRIVAFFDRHLKQAPSLEHPTSR